MLSDEPPYLPISTEVSAKFKGAFCEARIEKIQKNVKIKVSFKDGGTFNVGASFVRGDSIKAGASVEALHPQLKQFDHAVVLMVKDLSTYTVAFNDGDQRTLRRSHVCLKGTKHFSQTLSLDDMPLTNPDQFGAPVRKKQRANANNGNNSDSESLSSDTVKAAESEYLTPIAHPAAVSDVGRVVCVFEEKERKKWFPALTITPRGTKIRMQKQYLVRSFRDGRDHVVAKKLTKEFTTDMAKHVEQPSMKPAVEKAILYLQKGELPVHWDRDVLLGEISSSDSSDESNDDSFDDQPSEEKDRFVAQLYKFMDERGTPINKAPMVVGQDLDLYRLYKLVQMHGGYNKVCNSGDWKNVLEKMKLESNVPISPSHIKNSYSKYLNSFDHFYKKLGFAMDDPPRRRRPTASIRNCLQARTLERMRSVEQSPPLPATAQEPGSSKMLDEHSAHQILSSGDDTGTSAEGAADSAANAKNEFKRKLARSFMNRAANKIRVSPSVTPERSVSPDERSDSGTEDSSKSFTTAWSPRSEHKRVSSIASDEWQVTEQFTPGDFTAGQLVHVRYQKKSSGQPPLYEGKIVRVEKSNVNGQLRYFVHYRGWNARFDEYVNRDRLSEFVESNVKTRQRGPGAGGPINRPAAAITMDRLKNRSRHTSSGSTNSARLPQIRKRILPKRARRLSDVNDSTVHGGQLARLNSCASDRSDFIPRSRRYPLMASPQFATNCVDSESESESIKSSLSWNRRAGSCTPRSTPSHTPAELEGFRLDAGTSTSNSFRALASPNKAEAPACKSNSFGRKATKESPNRLKRSSEREDVLYTEYSAGQSINNAGTSGQRKFVTDTAQTSVEHIGNFMEDEKDDCTPLSALRDVSATGEVSSLSTSANSIIDCCEESDLVPSGAGLLPSTSQLYTDDFYTNSDGVTSDKRSRNGLEELSSFTALSSPPYEQMDDQDEYFSSKRSKQLLKSPRKKRRRPACPFPTRRPNRTPRHQTEYSDNEDVPSKKEGGASPFHYNSSTAALKCLVQQQMDENPNYRSKYQFNVIDPNVKGEELVSLLQHRIGLIKEQYSKVKTELQVLDRRRKKEMERRKRHLAKEKEREVREKDEEPLSSRSYAGKQPVEKLS